MSYYRKYGDDGLPDGTTINLSMSGSAGQSFCAFLSKGITVTLEGDANDYVGEYTRKSYAINSCNFSKIPTGTSGPES